MPRICGVLEIFFQVQGPEKFFSQQEKIRSEK